MMTIKELANKISAMRTLQKINQSNSRLFDEANKQKILTELIKQEREIDFIIAEILVEADSLEKDENSEID
jgi:hypothetical protein